MSDKISSFFVTAIFGMLKIIMMSKFVRIHKYPATLYVLAFSLLGTASNCPDQQSQVEQKQTHTSPPDISPSGKYDYPIMELYENLLSESDCRAQQLQAYASGCISDKGLRAMQVLKTAPVCTPDNKFSYWVSCDHQALREINKVLDDTGICSEKNQSGNCELETIHFQASPAKTSSLGQRIMVMENDIEELAALRYGSRVLDILSVNQEGLYESAKVEFRVPKAMKFILSDILDKKYPWMSPRSLLANADFYRKFEEYVKGDRHGAPILNQLAEFNPKADFVIAALPGYIPDDIFCGLSDKTLEHARVFLRNSSETLVQKIKDHKIDFVNMSLGYELASLEKRFPGCRAHQLPVPSHSTLKELLKIYLEEFYIPLTKLPNVIVVQAGAQSHNELLPVKTLFNLTETQLNYLTDCAELPNRLRVGFFDALRSGISITGSNDLRFLEPNPDPKYNVSVNPKHKKNSKECVDIFINTGTFNGYPNEEMTPKEEWQYAQWHASDPIGADVIHPVFRSTSFITPLGISYLIQLRRMNPELDTPQKLLEKAKSGGKLKDPLRHELHLFNVFGSDEFCDVGACEEEKSSAKQIDQHFKDANSKVDAAFVQAGKRIDEGFASIERQSNRTEP